MPEEIKKHFQDASLDVQFHAQRAPDPSVEEGIATLPISNLQGYRPRKHSTFGLMSNISEHSDESANMLERPDENSYGFVKEYNNLCAFCMKPVKIADCVHQHDRNINFPYSVHPQCFAQQAQERSPKNEQGEAKRPFFKILSEHEHQTLFVPSTESIEFTFMILHPVS